MVQAPSALLPTAIELAAPSSSSPHDGGAERRSRRGGQNRPPLPLATVFSRGHLRNVLLSVAVVAACLSTAPAAETNLGVIVGAWGRSVPGLDPGELLISELDCAACHRVDDSLRARLHSNHGMVLGKMAFTSQFIRSFLNDPQHEKPGTTMPDLLGYLNAQEKADAVDALVHFLISIEPQSSGPRAAADAFLLAKGRTLYHQIGCVACHGAQESRAALDGQKAGAAANPGSTTGPERDPAAIPLGNPARETTVAEMAKFLEQPSTVRPGGRMPSFRLNAADAKAIAMYLLRDQAKNTQGAPGLQKTQGLKYEYFEADFGSEPNFDQLPVKNTGTTDHFGLAPRQRPDNIGLRFSGTLTIAKGGKYTFYTMSDDGSRLYIGNQLVVQNDGMHPAGEKQGTIDLKPGEHPILVTYYNGGGESELKVSYRGPGLRKQEIPPSVLSYQGQPMIPLGSEEFAVDPAKAARGEKLFGSLGCAACHRLDGRELAQAMPAAAKPLLEIDLVGNGCLSESPPAGAARYGLSQAQRLALQTILREKQKLRDPLSPDQIVSHTLASLNCYACHERGGVGGPVAERAEYFVTTVAADLGDEGHLPPHLNGVGNKLRPDWLKEVLFRQPKVRPYMATRMPAFGEAQLEALMNALSKADGATALREAAEPSLLDAKLGRKLVGTGGLSCISCHMFGGHNSLGIPAMDLTLMPRRLRKEWFHRYLIDPAALRPGTRMPSFWPEGKAVNKEILEGNTDRQMDAIWAYLARGASAGLPDGLIQGKMELAATNEPIIYRNFIQGVGPRAIAVGYPEKANLAFDAGDLRLGLIWQGPFIDAARHRTGRGEGFEPPLGYDVISLPTGPAFAILNGSLAPWPDAVGKPAGYRMRGYRLDEHRRPVFLYAFKDIQIEDFPMPVAGELDAYFRRTLSLKTEHPVQNLWFRAATGSKIEQSAGSVFLVDGKLKLKFELPNGAGEIRVRRAGDRAELLVPISFQGGTARVVEDIIW